MLSDSFQIFFNQLKAAEPPFLQFLNEFTDWKKTIGNVLLCHLLLLPEICKFTVVDSKNFQSRTYAVFNWEETFITIGFSRTGR